MIKILSHILFIDFSMPRSIESLRSKEIPGAIVYNLDDIQEKNKRSR